MLYVLFLLTSFASGTQPLHVLSFFRGKVDVFFRSTSLERRLASLKVAPVVLGTYEGEDDNVYGHTSNEDALDKGIIWHVFWAIRSLNRRAEVFAAGYEAKGDGSERFSRRSRETHWLRSERKLKRPWYPFGKQHL